MGFDNEEFILEISAEDSIWNIKSKVYHDKVAKHVSWTKVAKTCVDGFENLNDREKDAKIIDLQKRWKNLRDNYRKKCVTKSGQAANKIKPYIYGNIMEFLRPTMENRRTEGNIEESSDNDIDINDSVLEENIDVQNDGDDENDIPDDPVKKRPTTTKTKLSKKPTFEENLLNILENRRPQPQDAETSFLMSLLPQIRSLTEEQKGRVYIEFLTTLQRVKYSTPQIQQIPSQVNSSSIPFTSLTYPYYNSNQTLPDFSTLSSAINPQQPQQIETVTPTLHTYYSQYNPQPSASSTHSGNIQPTNFDNTKK
ncbi:unnamed protein product [Macrosiphum euphorbiae]|uniref:MADF domain-containing protein n=1 Tax=Macrosiphum euphorbiae TaxID=13131 RepID=A0AAV0Y7G1_9HEMI|nr:unnamed protein product [Macrosiphum euphorbiae]